MSRACMIVTDLDGTLLNHDDYSFDPARPALAEIQRREIPLVLNSSKTAMEIQALQQQLDLRMPFICENGAAIFTPQSDGGWQVRSFSQSRSELLNTLQRLRNEGDLPFEGFADWDVDGIIAHTGLDPHTAELSAQRDFTEPVLWFGSDSAKAGFLELLAAHGITALQGGRFLSLSAGTPTDKGRAMLALAQEWFGSERPVIVALGDSPNDLDMLSQADIAVVIQSARSASMQLPDHPHLVRTRAAGPAGWQEAMDQLLPQL